MNTEPESTVSISCNDLLTVQPLSLDVENSSIALKFAQLVQENSELHAEVLVLKRIIDTLNSNVQQLNLSLLTDCHVQMYTGLPWKIVECLLTWLYPVSRRKGANDELASSQNITSCVNVTLLQLPPK